MTTQTAPRLPPTEYAAKQFNTFKTTTSVLVELLDAHPHDVPAALSAFEARTDLADFKRGQVLKAINELIDHVPVPVGALQTSHVRALVVDPDMIDEVIPQAVERFLAPPSPKPRSRTR